jgi:hypothetical protein
MEHDFDGLDNSFFDLTSWELEEEKRLMDEDSMELEDEDLGIDFEEV